MIPSCRVLSFRSNPTQFSFAVVLIFKIDFQGFMKKKQIGITAKLD